MFLSLLQFFATKFLVLALHLESGSFPRPLSAREETEAFSALHAGDPAAREKLIRHNLRLVAHIVKKYYALPGDQDDLISIGTIGLMKAVDTFDSDRRARFSTYASRCIENEIRMQFRRNRKTGGTVSLQEALESDGDSALTLADVLQDSFCMEDTCETQDDIRRMRQLLDGLPARERQIILLRYGLSGQPPLTQLETAKLLDISRSYVSRLETHALELLRQRWDVPGTKTAQRGTVCSPLRHAISYPEFSTAVRPIVQKYTVDSALPPAPFWKDAAAGPARSEALPCARRCPACRKAPTRRGRYR